MQKKFALEQRLLITVILFLAVATSRILILNELEFHPDEVWQAWSALGTFAEIRSWVPYDWPPMTAYFGWVWTNLVGIHPFALRLGSLFIAMLAYAITFRMARRMFGTETAAWGTTIVYAALGYSVFLSVFFRGYTLMMPTLSLALLFMLRYFDKYRFWDALGLGAMIALLFYTNLVSVTIFGGIGMLSLALYREKIWRWWLPGIIAGILAIPEILHKLSIVQTRATGSFFREGTTMFDAHLQLYAEFFGVAAPIWLGVLIVALGIIIFNERIPKMLTIGLLAFTFVSAPIIYALEDILGFFAARHSWWIILGLAMVIGAAFQYLPKRSIYIVLVPAIAAMFLPVPLEVYSVVDEPFEENFRLLKQHMQQGDVMYIDTNYFDYDCGCGDFMDWNYYQRVYFPNNGLKFVDNPTEHQRVWTVRIDGQQDPDVFGALYNSHAPSVFFGPYNFAFQLFEAPPDREGIAYENGLRFHGAQILGEMDSAIPLAHEGSTIQVRLWWSIDEPLGADYSVSLRLADDNNIIVQSDSAPQTTTLDYINPNDIPPAETSQWEVGRYYIEQRELTVPNPTEWGVYSLDLVVYQWWDGVRVQSEETDAEGIDDLMRFSVMSW